MKSKLFQRIAAGAVVVSMLFSMGMPAFATDGADPNPDQGAAVAETTYVAKDDAGNQYETLQAAVEGV
ncbi:MAG: hypothetical protein IJ347_10210, partial [Faecalibacterium sp.]|nr:hypothetical protein [Faecalibacterium sp.]